ncbi:S-layer homology domain-containing protein, partial [Escherichia coli]|nr:S-layer homology domain-containing protein [Escherichia coli]
VTSGVWYEDAVKYVYENGLMSGTTDTLFRPDSTTTRGMIVTVLHRLEGKPSPAASSFTDVKSDQYYAEAVSWAASNNIVNGYDN